MKRTALLVSMLCLLAACGKKDREIRAPGVVDGDIANVKALAGGTLESLRVGEGQAVQRGELIAEINRDKVRNGLAALDLAEKDLANSRERALRKRSLLAANLEYWQKQAQRFERLQQSRSISGEQLEKARLQLQDAQTSLFELDRSLEALQIQGERIANQRQALELAERDLLLKAPVSGVVLETFVSAGETVLPGVVLADILDLSSLFIDVFIEEREIAALKLGQPARIIVDGLEGRSFTGRIAAFGRKAEFSPKYVVAEKERRALLYQVKVRIEGDFEVFKVGMPVTVVFGG
ncbi:MAG: efflux RND transporter periplasmic adaptor subunit [Candidatus Aminicenantes bacterium]|nr:efflux RND transporter periplasmic adaptor subunit [Candidatus Aminicenantes bacterium]